MNRNLHRQKPIPATKQNLINHHTMTIIQYLAANISRIWDCPRKQSTEDNTISNEAVLEENIPKTNTTIEMSEPAATDWYMIDEEEWAQFVNLD